MSKFISDNTNKEKAGTPVSAQELTRKVLERVEESKKLYGQSIDAVRKNNPKEGLEAVAKTESIAKESTPPTKGMGNR